MVSKSKSVAVLIRQHRQQCARRAFPQTGSDYRDAVNDLSQYEAEVIQRSASVRGDLCDSGIAGTIIQYRFSYDVAKWLAKKAPKCVSIDWSELHDYVALDELLRFILLAPEDEYFDSGYVSTREWVETASAGYDGTDFDWLMAQLQERRLQAFFRQLYDAADLPLLWDLRGSTFSKSTNIFSRSKPFIRASGFRPRPSHVKKEIALPVASISRLSRSRGNEMIDVAIASMAVRHRETIHFNFANPDEVYVADVGEGVSVAVFGLLPQHRFPLECTMGYLILSNGVPIGYGGSSMVFKQANTGINIFDEYRRTEAAFLWVQVMRVYHSLFGCTRFIANPYQLGADNTEALQSGAFWFYYRLGYRPIDHEIRDLATREQAKRRKNSSYRSGLATLRRLASCDMHLTLPGARQKEFFDEEWLVTSSMLATELLGLAGGRTRQESVRRVVDSLVEALGMRHPVSWTKDERSGLDVIAPFVAALDTSKWTAAEKREVGRLLEAKGGKCELPYARLLAANEKLRQEMRAACSRVHKSQL